MQSTVTPSNRLNFSCFWNESNNPILRRILLQDYIFDIREIFINVSRACLHKVIVHITTVTQRYEPCRLLLEKHFVCFALQLFQCFFFSISTFDLSIFIDRFVRSDSLPFSHISVPIMT